jgi:hypothetical protein
MAEHSPIIGGVLLFIDPTGGTSYQTVVCLTSLNNTNEITVIEADSFCGPKKLPGLANFSIEAEGHMVQDPDSGKISGSDLRALMLSKTTIGYKIGPAIPVTGDEEQVGKAFISSLSDSYSHTDVATFSLALQPIGTPTFLIVV